MIPSLSHLYGWPFLYASIAAAMLSDAVPKIKLYNVSENKSKNNFQWNFRAAWTEINLRWPVDENQSKKYSS